MHGLHVRNEGELGENVRWLGGLPEGPRAGSPIQSQVRKVKGAWVVGKREARNAEHEAAALEAVTDEWMTAHQISLKIGMPKVKRMRVLRRNGEERISELEEPEGWRVFAFALRRLVDKGVLEMEIRKVAGKARTTEDQTYYRAAGVSRAMLPHWLAPQIPELRVLKITRIRCK